MPTHHEIDYVEISVKDIEIARRFYSGAFGWEFNDDHAGIKSGSGEMGGLRQVAEVRSGGPLVILYSGDLEASLQSVRSADATIVQEPIPFPGGRRFHFLDPSGNELAVWSPD